MSREIAECIESHETEPKKTAYGLLPVLYLYKICTFVSRRRKEMFWKIKINVLQKLESKSSGKWYCEKNVLSYISL